jgi:hypothetical protein
MSTNRPATAGALYYPYIHIKEVNWLKANLIIYPCVKRMLPLTYIPSDGEVHKFTQPFDKKDPLLTPVNINSPRSREAQASLASKLEKSSRSKTFRKTYGEETTRQSVSVDSLGFQIHAMKLSEDLKQVLAKNKLSWEPINREWYDFKKGYIEVHPRVGEAIMSTIAIACAHGEALDIVGDERSGELHHTLLEKDLESVYDAWLGPPKKMTPPKAPSGEKLMEFILGVQGDLSSLSLKNIYNISSQREPINKLVEALREHAANIPPVDDEDQMDEAFKDAASDVMKGWRSDRKNLRGFAKTFFGADSAKQATDLARNVAEKTLSEVAKKSGWFGSMVLGGLIAAGPGIVIGLVAHSGTTYYKIHQREENSPYRVLTTLERAGAVYRSDVIIKPERKA